MNVDKIKLNRAQMRYSGTDRLDITVKSANNWAKRLAPTWGMVWDHKNGSLSDEEYTYRYLHIIDSLGIPIDELLEFGKDSSITFVCYCSDGKFCHTHLLIDYLVDKCPESFEDGRNES